MPDLTRQTDPAVAADMGPRPEPGAKGRDFFFLTNKIDSAKFVTNRVDFNTSESSPDKFATAFCFKDKMVRSTGNNRYSD